LRKKFVIATTSEDIEKWRVIAKTKFSVKTREPEEITIITGAEDVVKDGIEVGIGEEEVEDKGAECPGIITKEMV